jgi:hypothetical protein
MQLSHRLFSALVALSTLSLPVFAGRSLRQHVEPRALVDTCATITARDLISVRLSLPKFAYDGCLDICLCLSTLPAAIHSNADLHQLVSTYGEDLVQKDLTLLVSTLPLTGSIPTSAYLGGTRSIIPETSRHANILIIPNRFATWDILVTSTVCLHMSEGANTVLASSPTGSATACAASSDMLVNSDCPSYGLVLGTYAASQGCGSAAPYQRRINEKLRARSRGIFTHEDALSTCAYDEQVCGVSQGSAAFECLNTDTALESCESASIMHIFLGAYSFSRQVVDAYPRILSSSCQSRALRELTARLFLTSKTSDALQAAVLCRLASMAMCPLQITPHAFARIATLLQSLSSLPSSRCCRVFPFPHYAVCNSPKVIPHTILTSARTNSLNSFVAL